MQVHTRDNMKFDDVYDSVKTAASEGNVEYTEEELRSWADAVAEALYKLGYIEFDQRTANYYHTEEAEDPDFDFANLVFWPTVDEYEDPAKW